MDPPATCITILDPVETGPTCVTLHHTSHWDQTCEHHVTHLNSCNYSSRYGGMGGGELSNIDCSCFIFLLCIRWASFFGQTLRHQQQQWQHIPHCHEPMTMYISHNQECLQAHGKGVGQIMAAIGYSSSPLIRPPHSLGHWERESHLYFSVVTHTHYRTKTPPGPQPMNLCTGGWEAIYLHGFQVWSLSRNAARFGVRQ